MKAKSIWISVGVAALVLFSQLSVQAQCAMCRATAESSLNKGKSSIADGLNTGILYLGAMPYLAFVIIGILWYRNSKKTRHAQNRLGRLPAR